MSCKAVLTKTAELNKEAYETLNKQVVALLALIESIQKSGQSPNAEELLATLQSMFDDIDYACDINDNVQHHLFSHLQRITKSQPATSLIQETVQ